MTDTVSNQDYYITFKRDYLLKNPLVFIRVEYKEKDGIDSFNYSQIQLEDYIGEREGGEYKYHYIKSTSIIVTCKRWVKSLIENYWC